MGNLLNMSRGSLLKKGLPYDAEIEYLESTGTQWVDTSIVLSSSNDIVEIKYKLTTLTSKDNYIFGCRESNTKRFQNNTTGGNKIRARWGSSAYSEISVDVNDILKFAKTADSCELFNLTKSTSVSIYYSSNNYPGTQTLLLFGSNNTSIAISLGVAIYSAKIGDLSLIPVRVGQVGYMYDKVSGQLFGNAGTGDFILGPDVN